MYRIFIRVQCAVCSGQCAVCRCMFCTNLARRKTARYSNISRIVLASTSNRIQCNPFSLKLSSMSMSLHNHVRTCINKSSKLFFSPSLTSKSTNFVLYCNFCFFIFSYTDEQ